MPLSPDIHDKASSRISPTDFDTINFFGLLLTSLLFRAFYNIKQSEAAASCYRPTSYNIKYFSKKMLINYLYDNTYT